MQKPPPFLSWVRWRFCLHLLAVASVPAIGGEVGAVGSCVCMRGRKRGERGELRPIFRASWAAHFGRCVYLKITKRILRPFLARSLGRVVLFIVFGAIVEIWGISARPARSFRCGVGGSYRRSVGVMLSPCIRPAVISFGFGGVSIRPRCGNIRQYPFCSLRCALSASMGRGGMFYRPRGETRNLPCFRGSAFGLFLFALRWSLQPSLVAAVPRHPGKARRSALPGWVCARGFRHRGAARPLLGRGVVPFALLHRWRSWWLSVGVLHRAEVSEVCRHDCKANFPAQTGGIINLSQK